MSDFDSDRLASIEATLQEIKTDLALLAQRHEDIGELKRAVFGNGNTGIRLTVDRLKQADVRRRWHFGVVYGALVAVGVKLAYDIISAIGGMSP